MARVPIKLYLQTQTVGRSPPSPHPEEMGRGSAKSLLDIVKQVSSSQHGTLPFGSPFGKATSEHPASGKPGQTMGPEGVPGARPAPPSAFVYVRMFSKMKQLEEEIFLKKERNPLIKNHKLDLGAVWARGGRAGGDSGGRLGPGRAGGGYSRPVEQHEQEGADDERL